MARAKWATSAPVVAVDAAGTLTVSLPVRDGGKLAATVRVKLTADRVLQIIVVNEPGAAGLAGFEAWSTK